MAFCLNQIAVKHAESQRKLQHILELREFIQYQSLVKAKKESEVDNLIGSNIEPFDEMKRKLDPHQSIDLYVFLKVICEGYSSKQGLGEIEAQRIESLFHKYKVQSFDFDTGLIGVDELYSRDFEEIIDQCLDRIAPSNEMLPVRLVRRGLLVNRESHTIPERRRSTQALLDNIKILGERDDEVKKKSFKHWIFKQFEKHQIEYL